MKIARTLLLASALVSASAQPSAQDQFTALDLCDGLSESDPSRTICLGYAAFATLCASHVTDLIADSARQNDVRAISQHQANLASVLTLLSLAPNARSTDLALETCRKLPQAD